MISDEIPVGLDATSMVCVQRNDYTAIITNAYSETSWVFHESRVGQDELAGIAHRGQNERDSDGDY